MNFSRCFSIVRGFGKNVRPSWCAVSRQYGTPISDPENKGEAQRGVNFETLGAWDNRIDFPILVDQSIRHGVPIPKISVSDVCYASVIGRRKDNEDRVVAGELAPNVSFFAILDGHGGSIAADFCVEHLEDYLKYWMKKETNIGVVLRKSFLDMNNMFTRHMYFRGLNSESKSALNGGTTATVCILKNSIELTVGHVGDSRAILCRKGEADRLTHDHHPEDEIEAQRIKRMGGVVTFNSLGSATVNNRLAMTRSIGDIELKPYGVIAEPAIGVYPIKHGIDAFLLLTTDGVNFVMSDQELVDIICTSRTPKEAVDLITDQALHFGSEDNCTGMIIPFGAWGKYAKSGGRVTYSFGRNIGSRYR